MSQQISELFKDGRTIALSKGKSLFRLGDPVASMFLVAAGAVDLLRISHVGKTMVLQRASTGQVLAEASAYARVYHCDGTAIDRALVRAIPVATFLDRLERSPEAARAWAAQLAHSLQGARMSAEIRSLRTVGERLDAWLGEGHELPRKGKWQDIAHTIGVSREALYRELAKRRR